MNSKNNRPEQAAELRKQAENIASEKAAQSLGDLETLSSEETRQMFHELRVHQVELEMQREDLRRAQVELDAQRAHYFDFFNSAPVGYLALSEKGLIIEANLTAETFLGVIRSALIRQPVSSFILPDDQDIFYFQRKQLFESGVAQTFDLRMVKKDGAAFWVNLALTTALDAGGVYRIVMSEITDRKRAKDELHERENTLQAVFDTTPVGICIMKNRVYQRVNRAWCVSFGYQEENLIGRTTEFLYESHEEYERIGKALDEDVLKKGIGSARTRLKRSDGEFRDVDLTAKLLDPEILYAGTVVVVHDITKLKQAEEALRKSEDWLKSVFRVAPVGIGVVKDRILLDANPRLCEMSGYAQKELIGTSARILYPSQEEFECVGREKYRQIAKIGSGTVETRFQTKDGSVIDVLLASTPMNLLNLSEGVTFTALDITERKRAEAEKEKLQAQLFQAQKMEAIGRLAGGVAHDFNNMLSIIIGRAELARMKLEPSDWLYNELCEIEAVVNRSASLTRQLLGFARKQTISPRILNLNDTIESLLKMLRRLIGENIDLLWKPASNLWSVKMDPAQIDQILANLVINARDAIKDVGKVTIETDNVVFDEDDCAAQNGFIPGQFTLFAVSDDGCGIDVETLQNIFEPFFTTKEIGKGTGLGLATVYGIVKQNNGFINVYSESGKGTTFKIYLPGYGVETARSSVTAPAQAAAGGHETVLLVEDEPTLLDVAKKMLEKLGHTVLTAGTPGEAIRLAGEHAGKIHLLMTDVVMPEMNGRDLAKHLRALYPLHKCLFMSGYTANVIAHHGVLDEGVFFIQKPFSMKDLAAAIRQVLAQK